MTLSIFFLLAVLIAVIVCRADAAGITPTPSAGSTLNWKTGAGTYAPISDVLTIDEPEDMQINAKYTPIAGNGGSLYAQKNPVTYDMGDIKFTAIWTASLWATIQAWKGSTSLYLQIIPSTGSNGLGVLTMYKSCKRVKVITEDDAIEFTGECVGPPVGG